jgi:hypothetical protein
MSILLLFSKATRRALAQSKKSATLLIRTGMISKLYISVLRKYFFPSICRRLVSPSVRRILQTHNARHLEMGRPDPCVTVVSTVSCLEGICNPTLHTYLKAVRTKACSISWFSFQFTAIAVCGACPWPMWYVDWWEEQELIHWVYKYADRWRQELRGDCINVCQVDKANTVQRTNVLTN